MNRMGFRIAATETRQSGVWSLPVVFSQLMYKKMLSVSFFLMIFFNLPIDWRRQIGPYISSKWPLTFAYEVIRRKICRRVLFAETAKHGICATWSKGPSKGCVLYFVVCTMDVTRMCFVHAARQLADREHTFSTSITNVAFHQVPISRAGCT